jgi:hypothetical protein
MYTDVYQGPFSKKKKKNLDLAPAPPEAAATVVFIITT